MKKGTKLKKRFKTRFAYFSAQHKNHESNFLYIIGITLCLEILHPALRNYAAYILPCLIIHFVNTGLLLC